MIQKTTLARPYAQALFELARDTQCMPLWSKVLSILLAVVQVPELQSLLEDRSLPKSILAKTLLDIMGPYLHEEGQHFLQLLVLNRRIFVLSDIASLYETLCLESQQRLKVRYETCIPLSPADKEKARKIFSRYFAKTVELEEAINEHLLGGYVASAGNVVIDASIAGYLDYLKGASV